METKRILQPNPNWEEDLEHATRMEDEDVARVLSYPRVQKKEAAGPKNPYCRCKVVVGSGGVAPVVALSSGKEMPAFALGTWLGANSSGMIPVTDYSVYYGVYWAISAGYRHIDTAAVYNTEMQVGLAINNKIEEGVIKRDDIFVTTKLWNDAHARDAVVPALRKSLQNLNLTYVDLYLIHWPTGQFDNGTFDNTDYLETWQGMQEARDQGLTKSIGVSNFNIHQLERLIKLSTEKPAVLQVEMNLNLQQPELLAYCCKHKVAVMAYTPFGSLFHGKAAEDAPPPRSDARPLIIMSDKYNKSVPQIALRYLVSLYDGASVYWEVCLAVNAVEVEWTDVRIVPQVELGVVPIPKSVTRGRIEANIQVYDFALTPEERKILKGYDVGYRTIVPKFLEDSPYYPFNTKQD